MFLVATGNNELAPKAIDKTTEAKYRRRFEEGYDVYDPEYYKWMKHNHPVKAEAWIKSAIRTEDASNVEKPISSTGNTDQSPESETTQKKSCENPGSSKPKAINKLTEAKYRRRFEEGYDVYDPEYYKWMKHNHPAEAEAWIKSAIQTEDASNVEKPISSTGNTDQSPESETTQKKSCENPGSSNTKSWIFKD